MKTIFFGLVLSTISFGANRIINGTIVPKGEHREVVSIQSGNGACTATIIGPRTLVTAAHCAASGDTVKFTVDKEQYVATVTRHPLYPAKDLDISVAVTDRDIEDVDPATVGGSSSVGAALALLGFGCVKPGGGGGNDGVLRIGTTVIVGQAGFDMVSRHESGAVLCFGDSGGPAYADGMLVGIASKGDIVTTNYHARLDSPEAQSFLASVADAHCLKICGVSADCHRN